MNDILRLLFRGLSTVMSVFSTLVVIRVILTWVLRGRSVEDNKITAFIAHLTDPYLNLFRNVKALQTSRIDFSPILALIPLNILQSVFSILATHGTITIPVILALIVQSLWNYLFKFIFKFWFLIMGLRLIVTLLNLPTKDRIFAFIDPIINTPVCRVWKIFYKKNQPDDKKLVLTALIFYGVIYFVMNKGLTVLINFLIKL